MELRCPVFLGVRFFTMNVKYRKAEAAGAIAITVIVPGTVAIPAGGN